MINIISSLVVVIASLLTFVPSMQVHLNILHEVILFASIFTVVVTFCKQTGSCCGQSSCGSGCSCEAVENVPKVSEPVVATSVPTTVQKTQADYADAVQLLALFQQKGRLVDFLMEDVTAFPDAKVGAAARVVHQGCRQVMKDHLSIAPVATVAENSPITLEAGYKVADYRLVGNLTGQAPFTGKVVHKGWRVASINLPRPTRDSTELPPIAPAEVEIK